MSFENAENSFVGKKYVDDRSFDTDITQSPDTVHVENVVRHSELPDGTRVVGPETMVTMDFNENRLNLHIDSEGNVTKETRG